MENDPDLSRSLRILHVAPAFYPATYWGGPTVSTYGLCNALAERRDLQLKVLTTDTAGPSRSDRVPVSRYPELYQPGYEVYFVRKTWGRDFTPRLIEPLLDLAGEADVLHLTATYSFPTLPVFLTARALDKPLVWSPRGAIQATVGWSGARNLAAKRVWHRVAARWMPRRTLIHATSEAESIACKSAFPELPSVVIPNAVEIPARLPEREWRPGGQLRLVFLGRLDPVKALGNLMHCLRELPAEVTLDIYGTGDPDYETRLRALAGELGLGPRLRFKGHLAEDSKAQGLASADILVLPSHSENFAMVVAEALGHGVPVICSKGAPWRGLLDHSCGWWVDNSVAALSAAVMEARILPPADLRLMGLRGRKWMQREFSWGQRAEAMSKVYHRLASSQEVARRLGGTGSELFLETARKDKTR